MPLSLSVLRLSLRFSRLFQDAEDARAPLCIRRLMFISSSASASRTAVHKSANCPTILHRRVAYSHHVTFTQNVTRNVRKSMHIRRDAVLFAGFTWHRDPPPSRTSDKEERTTGTFISYWKINCVRLCRAFPCTRPCHLCTSLLKHAEPLESFVSYSYDSPFRRHRVLMIVQSSFSQKCQQSVSVPV